jgi:hypothetical protein
LNLKLWAFHQVICGVYIENILNCMRQLTHVVNRSVNPRWSHTN